MSYIDRDVVTDLFAKSGESIYSVACRTVQRFGMDSLLNSGAIVGLSGGADSVMLLCFLLEYRRRNGLDFSIICVHVNHGIRGDEADRDEQFCRHLCEELGIDYISEAYSVPNFAKNSRVGIEEAARITRYSVFRRIIRGRSDLGCIAVAHNMSDNAETVIFNLLRGCGSRGASGIHPVRDDIVRPLIEISKSDIIEALEKAEIPYVTDSTNLSCDYTRNYIRHEIIPKFNRLSDDPEKMISRFSENARADDDFITSVAFDFLRSREIVRNSDLLALPYAVFVRVLSLMSDATFGNISSKIAFDVRANLEKNNFHYSIGGGATFVCERGVCRVSKNIGEKIDYCINISEGITSLDPFLADFILSNKKVEKTYLNVYKMSIQANLSSAIIDGSLYLRPKKDGDTVYYGGMTHKLKKLFSDRKIPIYIRGYIPILCDNKGVVWVPGFGVRDDGVVGTNKKDLFVTIGIRNEDDCPRLYLGNEFGHN